MSIDVERLLGHEFESVETTWTPDDVILYHLSLGAGNPPTHPVELRYTYEKDLQVLPTFATAVVHRLLAGQPGFGDATVDPRDLLSLGHELRIHEPLPPAAEVRLFGKVSEVYDAEWAAVIVLEIRCEGSDRRELFSDRYSLFLRGAGGGGAPPLPAARSWRSEGRPDFEIEVPTLPQLALVHRLCGDKNPLHVDPDLARAAGFPRPVLHGLATYGAVCRAVCNEVLAARTDRIIAFDARFVGVLFPGETIHLSVWRRDDELLVEAAALERRSPILAGARIGLASVQASHATRGPAATPVRAEDIAVFAAQRLAERLGLPISAVAHDSHLGDLGVDSVEAVGLTGDLEAWLGVALPSTLLYEHPTLHQVAQFLESRVRASGAGSSATVGGGAAS